MSLERPVVSIIVFAYEAVSYLPTTIDNLLQQTSENFEILVFSDSYASIHSWFERQPDARLRFVVQSNLGLADTYNQGVLEARGKYLAFVKAGDVWHHRKLEKQIDCLDRYPDIGLVHSPNQLDNWRPTPEILTHLQLPSSSVMVRKTCFERVGLFDPKIQIVPDWDMWIRLGHHYEFMAIAEPVIFGDPSPTSQSAQWLEMEQDLQAIIEQAHILLSPEAELQKHRSYSYASLVLAEHVLHSKNPDPAVAHNYLYQALQHDSLIIFSAEFCRLRWVIFHLSCSQSDRYNRLLQFAQTTGDRAQELIYVLAEYSQKILNWMLEEEDSLNFWRNRKVKQQSKDL